VQTTRWKIHSWFCESVLLVFFSFSHFLSFSIAFVFLSNSAAWMVDSFRCFIPKKYLNELDGDLDAPTAQGQNGSFPGFFSFLFLSFQLFFFVLFFR
jgi:hypothetical protein